MEEAAFRYTVDIVTLCVCSDWAPSAHKHYEKLAAEAVLRCVTEAGVSQS